MFLLRLKSCSRYTLIRRKIEGAVIRLNPAAGKKFRGKREGIEKERKLCKIKILHRKQALRSILIPVSYASAASTAVASVFSPAATFAPR